MLRLVVGLAVLGSVLMSFVSAEEPVYEMGEYQFAMLMSGDSTEELTDVDAQKIQEEHLAFLKTLHDDGRAVAIGPIENGGKFRGVVVLDVGSVAAAKELLAEDPWIERGHLKADVRGWYAAKNIFEKAPVFADLEKTYLGLLMRPKDAPEFSEEKLEELQGGHLANMTVMAEKGELVIAGPMMEDRRLRGLVLFRTQDEATVRELMQADPSIQARRLEVDLYPWFISKGTLPPR